MKNSEEAIENVLTGLRNAEPSAGMERRILDSLETARDKPSARSSFHWRRMLPLWNSSAWSLPKKAVLCGVGVCSLFVLALAINSMHRRVSSQTPSRKDFGSAGYRPAARATSAENGTHALQRSSLYSSWGSKRAQSSGAETESAGDAEPAADSDALALEEMNAASLSAPPMPLTAQERLLQRVTSSRNTVEIAMLDPVVREAQAAEEKAEFQRFFGLQPKENPEQSKAEDESTNQSTPAEPAVNQPIPAQTPAAQEVPASESPAPAQQPPAQPKTGEKK